MCGIAGILRHSGLTPEDPTKASSLIRLLRHRGPDGEGTFQSQKALLVQTRLALVDVEPHEMPLSFDRGRYRIVFNGEIYNHNELRKQLSTHFAFKTATDTEVLLAGWIEWGHELPKKIEGMFAFLIWDDFKQVAFAARDPGGVKPFFYCQDKESFFFASEPQALVKSGCVPFKPDEFAIAETLTAPFFSGASRTPFSNILPLEPGTTLTWHQGHLEKSTYFDWTRPSFHRESENLEAALENSVRMMTEGDSEVGAFLSGGLDSTLICALLGKKKVPTWTIEYPENESVGYGDSLIVRSSDAPWAAEVARYLELESESIKILNTEYSYHLRRTLESNDLISVWEQEVSQNILALHAAKRLKAVLVGDAADETHYGYPFLMNEHSTQSPKNILNYFGTVPLRKNLIRDEVGFFDDHYRKYAIDRGYSWITREGSIEATALLVRDLWLSRLLYNGDCHLMRHSLEGRVPFANRSVLQAAQRISFSEATHNGIEKWHLRKIAEKHLPAKLAWRPKSALSKNLAGRGILFDHLKMAWQDSDELITEFIEPQFVPELLKKAAPSDRDASLAYRILGTWTWLRSYL